jgi:hypothetical protein
VLFFLSRSRGKRSHGPCHRDSESREKRSKDTEAVPKEDERRRKKKSECETAKKYPSSSSSFHFFPSSSSTTKRTGIEETKPGFFSITLSGLFLAFRPLERRKRVVACPQRDISLVLWSEKQCLFFFDKKVEVETKPETQIVHSFPVGRKALSPFFRDSVCSLVF